ncbi:hypothetical protein FXB39_13590 [Nocardioides sp. BGMRC 2183]|nr:hypothetical protein FXB39_13590 [Nocardioides sp. BGMRC 2183]
MVRGGGRGHHRGAHRADRAADDRLPRRHRRRHDHLPLPADVLDLRPDQVSEASVRAAAESEDRGAVDQRDGGFTLIEVIVAFGLFVALVSASLVLLSWTQRTARDNTYRTTALNLAARELAITSDAFNSLLRGPETIAINQVTNANPLAGGTAGQPLTVDNVPYTVRRVAQWSAVGSAAASTCDDGTSEELAYLRVHVEVTWPGGGSPAEMDTVLTPLKGTYSVNDGHIGVKVIDRDGQPRGGQSVTINGPSGTKTAQTADDGCVLFAFVTPGSYTVTLDSTGYVDLAGAKRSVRTVTVTPGQLWRGSVSYDSAASVAARFVTADGYALPSNNNLPLMFSTSAGTVERAGTGNARTITDLWPHASGYEVWAGRCLDNDPVNTGGAREPVVASDPAVTTTVDVPLAPLTVRRGSGSATVTATSKPSVDNPKSPCSTMTITLGSTTGGTLKTSLPYGRWSIRVGSSSAADVTLTQAGTPPVVTP